MVDLREIIESGRYLEIAALGKRLQPTTSSTIPNECIFINSEGPDTLCYKDRDGIVHEIRTRPA